MNPWIGVGLSILGVVLIPSQVALFRAAMKWADIQSEVRQLSRKLAEMIEQKNRDHDNIYKGMQDDRLATNQRLRWLEEHVWRNRSKDVA